ncbi:MAG: hypothetical protein E7478_02950 [Ruminococcaceae bacterium]|nr:hypothetical protein [Oscillospiraceae bacterium]
MAGITYEKAVQHLEMWLGAEEACATGQSYTIGTRSLTRANLGEIRSQIEYWNGWVTKLKRKENGGGRNRIYRVVPRDF